MQFDNTKKKYAVIYFLAKLAIIADKIIFLTNDDIF